MSSSKRKLRRKLEHVANKSKPTSIQQNHLQVTNSQFSYKGPLPPSSELLRYNDACPGAANRIISMAEKQAEHRQCLEKRVVAIQSRNSLVGIISAFVICITTILSGAYCVYSGAGWPGAALSLGGLASLCGVFIYGTNNANNTKQEKDK